MEISAITSKEGYITFNAVFISYPAPQLIICQTGTGLEAQYTASFNWQAFSVVTNVTIVAESLEACHYYKGFLCLSNRTITEVEFVHFHCPPGNNYTYVHS